MAAKKILTVKQRRYVDCFDGDIKRSAFVETFPKEGYYVYALVDSLKDEIFYIGKGKGNRMYSHVRKWKSRAIPINYKKYDRLCEIFDNQRIVKYKILYKTDNENDAYEKEKQYIKSIGLKNLTNLHFGGKLPVKSRKEKDRIYALKLLSMLKPNNGDRSKIYPLIRNFIISVVEQFGYIVRESSQGWLKAIKIKN